MGNLPIYYYFCNQANISSSTRPKLSVCKKHTKRWMNIHNHMVLYKRRPILYTTRNPLYDPELHGCTIKKGSETTPQLPKTPFYPLKALLFNSLRMIHINAIGTSFYILHFLLLFFQLSSKTTGLYGFRHCQDIAYQLNMVGQSGFFKN